MTGTRRLVAVAIACLLPGCAVRWSFPGGGGGANHEPELCQSAGQPGWYLCSRDALAGIRDRVVELEVRAGKCEIDRLETATTHSAELRACRDSATVERMYLQEQRNAYARRLAEEQARPPEVSLFGDWGWWLAGGGLAVGLVTGALSVAWATGQLR
ncbi:MAG: hypothetical protein ACE5EX_01800 [Phycisphaerae bacterium]